MNPQTTPTALARETAQAHYAGQRKIWQTHGDTEFVAKLNKAFDVDEAALTESILSALQRWGAELEAELSQSQAVIIATRQAATAAMDEVRLAVGAPLSKDDPSKNRAVDYVAALAVQLAALKSAPAVTADWMQRAAEERTKDVLEMMRGWFIMHTSGENCMNTLVDVFTAMRDELEDDQKMLPMVASCLSRHAPAREDTERMNWLIKQGPPGAANGLGLNDETWEAATSAVSEELQTDNEAVRAAIDAAMKEAK